MSVSGAEARARRPGDAPSAGDAAPGRRRAAAIGLVFAVALLLRALHLLQLRGSPFLEFPLGDAAGYDAWARRLAAGDWLGSEVFYQAPLYPYFLGLLYATVGDGPLVVRGAQALLGAGACALLAGAGMRWFGGATGLAAGLLWAVYAPALFFDGLLQKSVLDGFWVALLLALLARAGPAPRAPRAAALGAVGAALLLTRENAAVWVPVVGLWLGLRARGGAAARLRVVAAFGLGLALLLAPVALRNRAVGGELHLTTSQLGPNLYIGNHAGASGLYEPLRPGRGSFRFERQDARELAERDVGRALTPGQVSDYWRDRALDWMRREPVAWARLLARKGALLLDATEAVDSEDQYTLATHSAPLRILGRVAHFGVLAPLALLGIVVTWRRRRELWVLHALLASYAASVLLFYVFARYRYPLVPIAALFAGAGLAQLSTWARRAGTARVAAALAAALALALFAQAPRISRVQMRAVTLYNLGNALRMDGQWARAADHYQEALALAPEFGDARHNLADTLRLLGRPAEAEQRYRENLRRNPRDAPGHNNLGNLLLARGALEAAAGHYQSALAIDPHDAEARYNLALARFRQSRWNDADAALRALLAAQPGHARGHLLRARTLERAGRPAEAARHQARARALAPPRSAAPPASPEGVEEQLRHQALQPE